MDRRRWALKSSHAHLALLVVWCLLVVPTLTAWKDSITWIALMSIYSNISTHWGAWEAARAKEATDG